MLLLKGLFVLLFPLEMGLVAWYGFTTPFDVLKYSFSFWCVWCAIFHPKQGHKLLFSTHSDEAIPQKSFRQIVFVEGLKNITSSCNCLSNCCRCFVQCNSFCCNCVIYYCKYSNHAMALFVLVDTAVLLFSSWVQKRIHLYCVCL